ncbi:MAG: helix-turn-helix domain-containing protein [Lachnospiraceae bacterium]
MESNSRISAEIMNNIDEIMKKNHINAKDFAEKIGKRPGIVTDWRTGRSTPTIDVIINICVAFNCSIKDILPDYLFTEQSSIQTAMIDRLIAYYRGMSVDDQDELLMLAEYKYNKKKKIG